MEKSYEHERSSWDTQLRPSLYQDGVILVKLSDLWVFGFLICEMRMMLAPSA